MTATTTAPAPASRLSTTAIIAIAFVAILVLGGIGALIGKSAESDTKLPTRLDSPIAKSNLHAGTLSHLTAVPHSTATGGGPADNPAADSVTVGDVTVPVPPDWEATVSDDTFSVYMSKPGFDAYLNVYHPAVTPDPAIVVSQLLDSWVKQAEGYSDVTTGRIRIDPDIDGYAYILYSATWTGTSGSFVLVGELDAFVRADGEVLGVQRQAGGNSVPEALDSLNGDESVQAIVQGAGESFLNG